MAGVLITAGKAMGGPAALQCSVYVATMLLSNIVANNAAAALMFPIAIRVAKEEGLDNNRMAFLLMLAASASFAVPFGYQTNLMVYGAGGYQFKDFLRFGGPLQVRICMLPCFVLSAQT
jgi:di/tricarboxylate transporter